MYTKSLLVFVLLATLTNEGQMSNWLSDLHANLDSLQSQIHDSVQNLQEDIQSQVQRNVAHVNDVTAQVNRDVAEAIKNGSYSTTVSGNGGVVVMNSPGVFRTITSGTLPNGKPFWYDVEEKIIGNNLIHTERYFNDTNEGMQVLAYSLNLADKNAKPVPINVQT